MFDGNDLITAVIALAAGLLLGELAGRILRTSMMRPGRSRESHDMARPLGTFVFWCGTASGIMVAAAVLGSSRLDNSSDQLSAVLPRILGAAAMVMIGYALASAASIAIGQSALRATGVRHRNLERAIRFGVLGTAVALALGGLGVDSAVLAVSIGLLGGMPLLAMALLTASGARDVAANLSAGRALRSQLRVGYRLATGDRSGVIIALHSVTVEIETDDGSHWHLPISRLLHEPFSVDPVRKIQSV